MKIENIQHAQRKAAAAKKEASNYVDGEGWTRVAQSPYKTRRALRERRATKVAA